MQCYLSSCYPVYYCFARWILGFMKYLPVLLLAVKETANKHLWNCISEKEILYGVSLSYWGWEYSVWVVSVFRYLDLEFRLCQLGRNIFISAPVCHAFHTVWHIHMHDCDLVRLAVIYWKVVWIKYVLNRYRRRQTRVSTRCLNEPVAQFWSLICCWDNINLFLTTLATKRAF